MNRVADDRWIVDYFKRTCAPTEAFFHSMLLPRWAAVAAPGALHFMRFFDSANPRVLDESMKVEMLASGKFFARKFDSTSGPLLDWIDEEAL
jgi:hypothetical protein